MNKLRLQRMGRSYAPSYRLLAISSRYPQSSSGKAVLGVYHPKQGSSTAVAMSLTLKYIKSGSRFTPNGLRSALRHLNKKSKSK